MWQETGRKQATGNVEVDIDLKDPVDGGLVGCGHDWLWTRVSQLRPHVVAEKLLSVLYSGSPPQRSLQASSDHGMARELAGGDFRFVGTAVFTFRDRHATGQ